jgi:hypothetical protein
VLRPSGASSPAARTAAERALVAAGRTLRAFQGVRDPGPSDHRGDDLAARALARLAALRSPHRLVWMRQGPGQAAPTRDQVLEIDRGAGRFALVAADGHVLSLERDGRRFDYVALGSAGCFRERTADPVGPWSEALLPFLPRPAVAVRFLAPVAQPDGVLVRWSWPSGAAGTDRGEALVNRPRTLPLRLSLRVASDPPGVVASLVLDEATPLPDRPAPTPICAQEATA